MPDPNDPRIASEIPGDNATGNVPAAGSLQYLPLAIDTDWSIGTDRMSFATYWLPESSIDGNDGSILQQDPSPYLVPGAPLSLPFVHRLAYTNSTPDGDNPDDNYNATAPDCGGNGDRCREGAVKFDPPVVSIIGVQLYTGVSTPSVLAVKPSPEVWNPFHQGVVYGPGGDQFTPVGIMPTSILSVPIYLINPFSGLPEQRGTFGSLYQFVFVRKIVQTLRRFKAKPDGTADSGSPFPIIAGTDNVVDQQEFLQGGFAAPETGVQCKRTYKRVDSYTSDDPPTPITVSEFQLSDVPSAPGNPCWNPADDPCGRYKFPEATEVPAGGPNCGKGQGPVINSDGSPL